jgi:hypothetical protein
MNLAECSPDPRHSLIQIHATFAMGRKMREMLLPVVRHSKADHSNVVVVERCPPPSPEANAR